MGDRIDGLSRAARRAFAVVSVALMVLVSLEAAVGDVWAEAAKSSEDESIFTDLAPGTVESYGGGSFIKFTDAGQVQTRSYVENRSGQLIYWTPYGHYVVNTTNPEKLSFFSLSCSLLANESYFTVRAGTDLLATSGGVVVFSSDDRLEVEYQLLSSSNSTVGKMKVSYDFSGGKEPKATAELVAIDASVKDWCVSWVVTLNSAFRITSPDVGWGLVSLADLVGHRLSLPSERMRMNIGTDLLTADWTDAAEESVGVAARSMSDGTTDCALEVTFAAGRNVVDPVLVSSSTQPDPTGVNCQRKTFYYNGYYWLFYLNSTAICYRNSANGTTWSGELTMPESTTPATGTGFDVASRNGYVAVGWMDTSVWIKKGILQGSKIVWSSKIEICPYIPAQSQCVAYAYPTSVAIGYDNSFWIHFVYHGNDLGGWEADVEQVSRSTTGEPGTFSAEAYWWGANGPDTTRSHWYSLLPTANGYMALLETSYKSASADNIKVAIRYYTGIQNWTGYLLYDIGMDYARKSENFSAVASLNGTIHIAYKATTGYVKYARIYPFATTAFTCNLDTALGLPTIALDANGVLHAFYVVDGTAQSVYHKEKPEFTGSWSSVGSSSLVFSGASGAKIKGLTASANPVDVCSLGWAERSASTSVKFASIPLPFGTAGAPSQPWNRDGLSPYGTYFSMNSDYVSPGSGLLTLISTDVSIPGRAGLDLSISHMYQQPRYFWNSDGSTYRYSTFPFISLGQRWSLDLPWIDSYYVYLANGQRIMISWGNEGNQKEFVNRQDTPFVLRNVTKATTFFELITSSGLRYKFDSASPNKLLMISDLSNYDPLAATETVPYNRLSFAYSGNTLQSITDSALGRSITFTVTGGVLTRITRPDGAHTDFNYTAYGGRAYLTRVTDPDSRVTTYSYNSTANYCLNDITYPTGGKVSFCYASDSSPATEVKSWLVTKESLKNGTSGALIRQTNFDYKVVNGDVIFTKMTSYNETAALQGYNEYIFRSAMKSYAETIRNATGVQMQAKVTWYDSGGRPARLDSYKGNSAAVNTTEYMSYDDWGNLIFTRDALGHGTYTTFANTSTQNSFQGGDVLERSASGKIFYDAFDDWDFSDWQSFIGAGCSVSLDGAADPPRAPALKITRTSGTANGYMQCTFADQAGAFFIQTSFKVDRTNARGLVQARASSLIRIDVIAYNGYFQYNNAQGQYVNAAPCAANTWYDVGFRVNSNGTYDIFIDGKVVKSGAPLKNSGSIKYFVVKAEDGVASPISVWFDNVRIYQSLTISVGGLGTTNYILELFDSNGALINRTKTSPLTIPALPLNAPPAYIKLTKVGNASICTPMTDIWGGDSYTLKKGYYSSNLVKTGIGFGSAAASTNDDSKPTGSTEYWSVNNGIYDLKWVTDANYAVSGSKYHLSQYVPSWWDDMNHWHGFNGSTSPMSVSSTDVLLQYVWLEDGKIPLELSVQYYVQGAWRRAFWGGNGAGGDIILTLPAGFNPSSGNMHYMGPVPSVTGQWIQLAVNASVLGITGTQSVTGIIYALYSGTARWDYSSKAATGISVTRLSSGMVVKMVLDNGTIVSKTSTGTQLTLYPYSKGVNVFPVAATFYAYSSGGALLYASPRFPEICSGDTFTYSSPSFYANAIKYGIHSKSVGTFAYQDAANTIPTDSYVQYDREGNGIEAKSRLGTSSWVYAQAGYDVYGNQIWSRDATGRTTYAEYSSSNAYTYPVSQRLGDLVETLDFDYSWTSYKWADGSPTWLTAGYSSTRSYSPSRSFQISFASAPSGLDDGGAEMYKEFKTNKVQSVSVRMYLETYSHGGTAGELMDSGIRIRLYDAAGSNYATYSYWLACWSGSTNNRTADPNTKVIYGKPTMGAWINPVLYPNNDFNINWTACDKVRFSVYVTTSMAQGDQFKAYFDDFAFNDVTTNKTTYTYHLNNGRVLSMTDALGHVTSQQYDVLGRVTRSNETDGKYTITAYDDEHNKVTVTDQLGRKVVTYYDSIGRAVKSERDGYGSTAYSITRTYYNWQDEPSKTVDAAGRVTKCTYDYLGRTTSVKNNDGTVSSVSYDDTNKKVTAIDEKGHRTTYLLDVLGRLNTTREYSTATAYNRTEVTYDAVGNVKTVKTANNEVTRLFYDSLGRQTSIMYPDGYSESYTYDAAGRVLDSTARSGVVTRTAYDTSGSAIRVIGATETIAAVYDAEGKVLEERNALGSIVYQYDVRHRVSRLTERINSTSYSISYTYKDDDSLSTATYPDGRTITYLYDAYGRNVDIKYGTTKLLNVTYNVDDTVATKKYYNASCTTTFTYNNRGFVQSIVTKNSTQGRQLDLNYTYDAKGNVATIRDALRSVTEYYYYDHADRLIRATGNWNGVTTLTYTYDSMGNRQTKNEGTAVTYTYSTYNKLTGDGTYSYAYDRDGNVIWKNRTNNVRYNYVYNSFGQMTEVKRQTYSGGWGPLTTIARYYYDANGARAKTDESGTIDSYVYAGHDPLLQIGSDGRSNKYLYLGGNLEVRQITGSESYVYIADALGSTRKVLKNGDSAQTTFSASAYMPFGKACVTSGSDEVTFAGETLDSLTGLVYLFARYYDPELGRFYALDPELGKPSMPQTLNRYVYCGDNPLLLTDPTGMGWLEDIGKWFEENWETVLLVVVTVAVTVFTAGLGDLALLPAIALGTAAGGISNSFIYAATAGDSFTWEDMLCSGVEGAIGGALSTVSLGIGTGAVKTTWLFGQSLAKNGLVRILSAGTVGSLGGMLGYFGGEATRELIPGGEGARWSIENLGLNLVGGFAGGVGNGLLGRLSWKLPTDDLRGLSSGQFAMTYGIIGGLFPFNMYEVKRIVKEFTGWD